MKKSGIWTVLIYNVLILKTQFVIQLSPWVKCPKAKYCIEFNLELFQGSEQGWPMIFCCLRQTNIYDTLTPQIKVYCTISQSSHVYT